MVYYKLKKISILTIWGAFIFMKVITITQAELSVVFTDIDLYASLDYFAPNHEVFLLDEGIDNQIFVNLTLIKSPPEDATVHMQILGATMGEYKINTGFEYNTPMCKMIDEPIIFGRMTSRMGVKECPPPPGTFGHEAYEIDVSTLPDTFPPNKYILNVCLEDNDTFIGNFTLYFTIQ